MSAPQSDIEVLPVVAEINRLVDPHLDIVWNPKAVMVAKGSYNAVGQRTEPTYRGLWEIRRLRDPNATESHRDWRHIMYVTEPKPPLGPDQPELMQEDGPYAPVGEWLVRYLCKLDRYNVRTYTQLQADLDTQNAKAKRDQDAAMQEAYAPHIDRTYFDGTMEGGVSQFYPVKTTLTA